MPVQDIGGQLTRELTLLLEETFERVHGVYLDRQTSLGETLSPLTAAQASQPISQRGMSIASHIAHVLFYLDVAERSVRGEDVGKLDWEESWTTRDVTPEQWADMQTRLGQAYQSIRATIAQPGLWDGEDTIGGTIGIVAHTAYHLGAIRLALDLIS